MLTQVEVSVTTLLWISAYVPYAVKCDTAKATPTWLEDRGIEGSRDRGIEGGDRASTAVGEMTRHGRNATASAVYTYHEKKKDSAKSGYGSKTVRLGKDSVKEFDCCCLTLQPCRNPVATPDGYLFDKEAILEYILHQKKENAKKLKEFERQKKKHETEMEELATAEARSKVEKFLATEKSIVTKQVDVFSRKTDAPSISNMAVGSDHSSVSTSSAMASSGSSGTRHESNNVKGKKPKLPSFWIPSLTPSAKPTEIKKPDTKTYCPMSGKELRVKDLISVKFTPIKDGQSKTATIVKETRYMCPVTRDVINNSVPCVVLRPSGDVITQECVDKLIRPNNMLCPISGKVLKEKDLIALQRGGTGFAGSGVELKATKAGSAMMA